MSAALSCCHSIAYCCCPQHRLWLLSSAAAAASPMVAVLSCCHIIANGGCPQLLPQHRLWLLFSAAATASPMAAVISCCRSIAHGEPDGCYIAVPLAEPVAMPPAAPPATATALQLHQCPAGADWPGLMIFINMTFSSMIFVIMLRWLTPPTAAAAAATHCSGGRRLLPHDPRHSRGRLGWIEDLHHHDLQHHDRRHHAAVADGDMLRWLQSASPLDLNCSYCHYSSEQRISHQ